MLRAYKYRIYPSEEQKLFFAKTFGCVRLVYNCMLADRIKAYEAHKDGAKKMKYPTPASYKVDYPFLKEVDSLALANAQMNLDAAYKNFFRDKNVGFPKFKSKKNRHQTYTTNNQRGTVYIDKGYLKIPKLKSLIKIVQHRPFSGLIKSVTISRVPSGKYYVSMLVDSDEVLEAPHTEEVIGLDVGLKDFCITSKGEVYGNPKHFRKSEKRLAKLQKDLSRKEKGSRNREKARLKVAKLHERITHQRADFLHKLSTKIIRENQTIVIEDLRVKNMLKNPKLAKVISEASWSEFRRMLTYKSDWYHRNLIVAPTNYPSSQLCSHCGYKNPLVKNLGLREWTCPECGVHHDRDENAAKNLEALAVQ